MCLKQIKPGGGYLAVIDVLLFDSLVFLFFLPINICVCEFMYHMISRQRSVLRATDSMMGQNESTMSEGALTLASNYTEVLVSRLAGHRRESAKPPEVGGLSLKKSPPRSGRQLTPTVPHTKTLQEGSQHHATKGGCGAQT